MNKTAKKLLAGTLSATMIIGSSATVFAAETSNLGTSTTASTGTGQLEGYVLYNVSKVVLPTSIKTDFTLDPQGLLGVSSDSSKYTEGAGAVYFPNAKGYWKAGDKVYTADGNASEDWSATSDSANSRTTAHALDADDEIDAKIIGTATGYDYSSTSDAIEITNKSSFDISVEVAVAVKAKSGTTSSALSDVALVDADTLATAKDPSLYLGVVVTEDGADEDAVAITADGQTVTGEAEAIPKVADAVLFAADDIVYTTAANKDAAITNTADWSIEPTDTLDTEHVVTADDTAIVGEEKTPEVTEGYELSSTDDEDEANGATVSPNGHYYYYALTTDYTSRDEEKVSFKLTGATNDVDGWSEVTENISTEITYTITGDGAASSASKTVYASSATVSSSNATITLKTADGTVPTVSSVYAGSTKLTKSTHYTYSTSTGALVFKSSAFSKGSDSFTINYGDGKTDTIKITQ